MKHVKFYVFFTFSSKVHHTFFTFIGYSINHRRRYAFYKIFFFFIRAGTKVPASFHLWNFFYFPIYIINKKHTLHPLQSVFFIMLSFYYHIENFLFMKHSEDSH